jgi:hypothetical protein
VKLVSAYEPHSEISNTLTSPATFPLTETRVQGHYKTETGTPPAVLIEETCRYMNKYIGIRLLLITQEYDFDLGCSFVEGDSCFVRGGYFSYARQDLFCSIWVHLTKKRPVESDRSLCF